MHSSYSSQLLSMQPKNPWQNKETSNVPKFSDLNAIHEMIRELKEK